MPVRYMPELKAGPFGTRGGPRVGPIQITPKLPPPKPPAGVRIENRIGIQAPAEVIWEVISDLRSWEQWNKLYPKASGQIHIGSVLDLTLALPDQAPQEIKPVVLEWVPNEQLHWKLTMLGGLARTIRYLEIEAIPGAGCIISNGEIFGGFLGPRVAKRMGRNIQRAFLQNNEDLKARAESLWEARQNQTV